MRRFLPILTCVLVYSSVVAHATTARARLVSASADADRAEAVSTAYINKVYEYVPAPGQFINVMPAWEEGDDESAMLQKVSDRICGETGGLVCLGAWGGYITFGFDHTIVNLPDSCDFEVRGNSFYSKIDDKGRQQGSAEPGVIYVSRDDNGNGLPDDPWYEIAGSEFPLSRRAYSVTYNRPTSDTLDVIGTDIDGNIISVSHNIFHQQAYYPKWLPSSYTLSGTLLPSNVVDDATHSWLVFAYGYADNHPNNNPKGFIDISLAVDASGNPANLRGIDFVRVQTGVYGDSGEKGEVSTEISGARDLHPAAGSNKLSAVISHQSSASKTIVNGQVVIHRGEEIFDILGRPIR